MDIYIYIYIGILAYIIGVVVLVYPADTPAKSRWTINVLLMAFALFQVKISWGWVGFLTLLAIELIVLGLDVVIIVSNRASSGVEDEDP